MLNEQEAVTKEIDDLIGMDKAGRNPPLATENLLENTDGATLGAAACCLLFMLTRALLMTSSHSEG